MRVKDRGFLICIRLVYHRPPFLRWGLYICIMARRAKKSLPLTIKLSMNIKTGFYEGEENGIIYQLTFEQYNDMKTYYKGSWGYEPTITAWYHSLSRFDKPNVKRLNAPRPADDFTPDPDWPE